ncbi:MAG: methylmalonyl-CoA epimerase [candidate division NC10 bacterium]|nr:methylmalonyl-CoA epimerase [candidate division NC10 bacterium]MDE2484231.1 methylmalonyl-CoA epimerase [candidate division NC10 bacterium]
MRRIEHIAIAVKDVEASTGLFKTLLGINPRQIETLPDEHVKVACFELGGSRLELVQGIGSDNPMSKFIERRGEGLHHICLEVEDLPETLRLLDAAGFPLIDSVPKPGSSGTRVAFLHPKGCNGVLIELVEQPSGA